MITTDIDYPKQLPWPTRDNYTLRDVPTFERTDMVSGRAAQRRTFSFVPTMVTVTWLFTSDTDAMIFTSWFHEQLNDGVEWFNCPLKTPLGEREYVCRFASMPQGPDLVGLCSWRVKAELEMFERPLLPDGWTPDWIRHFSLFDIAMNRVWPKS